MQKINCPECNFEIDIDEALYAHVKNQYQKEFNDVMDKGKTVLAAREKNIDNEINKRIADEKLKIKSEVESEQEGALLKMKEELAEKNSKLVNYNKAQIEIEQLKRKNEEVKQAIELEAEKKLSASILEEKQKIAKVEADKSELKLSEKNHIIDQLRESLNQAQLKAEQGSMQIQGEVQELAIEDFLKGAFPIDNVGEIKKGAKGADCIHTINTTYKNNCGTILYESKRSKHFQPTWIEKFKNDLIESGASVGVLITETMPSDSPTLCNMGGVWVCTFDEFKGLSRVLRDSLIKLDALVLSQEGKGDKMEMLYTYLTGNEFNLRVSNIVDGFVQMKADLESEKRALSNIWKKREKQIDKVLLNTTGMHGSIVGIGGSSVQPIPLLELDGGKL